MGRRSLSHQLLCTNLIERNFQKGIPAHFNNRKYHTAAKGSMLHHVTFIQFQISSFCCGSLKAVKIPKR